MNKNIPYYLIALGLFIILKLGYTLADNNDLILLLKPTDQLVGFLTGSDAVFLPESGYFHEKLNIIIDKSCSGFNFWALSFLIFTYLITRYVERSATKIMVIPITLIGAYLLTIVVNASRIYVSIVVQSQTKDTLANHQHSIHEVLGIATNLTFLILGYILTERFLTYKKHHAKLR